MASIRGKGRDLAPIQQTLVDKVSGSEKYLGAGQTVVLRALQICIEGLTNEDDQIIVPAYGWRAFCEYYHGKRS